MSSSVQDAAKAYSRLMHAIVAAETPSPPEADPDTAGDAYIDAIDDCEALTGDTPAVTFVKGYATLRMAHVACEDAGLDFIGILGAFQRNLMPADLRATIGAV